MSEFDFLKRGVDYLNHNDYQQAIEQFDRALEINPNFAEAYYLRGITHRQMDDTSQAVEDYTQALQIKPNLSEAHTSRASARSNIGDYKGAVEDYTQVLQSNPFDIEAYVNRGLVETRLGNNQAAIEDCTKALRLNPNYASAYVNRGLARSNIGDFNGALKDWTQAVENAPNDAQAYSNRCFVRAELGDPQGALEDCNQALQINPSFDQAYANRGFVRSQLGDYEGAIEDCNQSLQLNPDEPETYYHRATAHYHLGNRQAADKDLKQAAELYFQQGRTDDYHYQAVLDNIKQLQVGAVLAPPVLPIIDETEIVEISISPRQAEADTLLRQGMEQSKSQQFNAAGLELYRQALEIYRENEDDWGKNLSIIELGEAYNSQGIKQYFNREFEAALKSYQTALTLYRESDYLSGKADVLYNLGMAYDIFNRRKKAIEYFQQSLDIARKIGDRHREGRCLGSLGISYLALALEKDNRTNEDYQEALKCYEESLAIAREISDLRGQWLALQSLGNIFILQEQYDSGIDCYQQSLTKARESADLYGEGFALGNIGAVYLSQGNYSKAIEYFQQVLEISRELKEWNTEAINLERLGLALFKSGNLSESENRLRQAIEVYEKTWAGHGQNNLEKTSILDVQQNAYQLLQQVLIARGQIENALGIADRGRARAIADLLARRLSDGQKERVEIIPLTIEQIKNVAKEQNATLVEYTIINDFDGPTEEKTRDSMLFIWVIKPTGEIHFRTIDLKPFLQGYTSTLEKLVSVTRISIGARGQFRKAQVDRAERKAVVDRAERVVRVNELYNILIEPIADLLPIDASDRVIFIPQGPLFLVPFPALKNKSGKYLIEQHTILTATSIKVLELTREHQERVQAVARKDMLVVGNPTMPSISFEVGQKPQKLDPLPGAEKEALAIAPLLNTKALIGNEATKVAIVKRMASSRIIHLATHGLLEDFRKQDVPGAIALAPSATDDGLLTAAEILEFKLNAELVVLSACDTGQGRLTVDGVIGLSRSLIAAGVPSVIVSLWSVPDAATAFLMMEFYQNLQGNLDKAQALRQAMLTTMKKYPDPISWAAFTLIGEANSAFSFSATGKLVVTRAAGYVLNYIASFNEELQQIGQISPQEFAEQYPTHAEYLPQISYDPTTAKFWDEFNLDPEENNNNPNSKNRRNKDFRLNREELAVFKKNGVVVSERLGASSFAELFYSIYNNDLPVFVSADAILHAWHRSYDAMLEELEETYLAQSLDEILESMAQGISECWLKYSNGVLGLSVKDADYFLAVARSLLQGAPVKTQLNQDARVEGTLAAVQRQELQELTLFGRNRQMDFSQFKVRGHYEHSEPLQRYFQAMMWCGRVDLRIAGTPEEASPRELGAAVIFCYLLEQSGKFYQWQQFDEMLQTFVGKTDSMTFAQLDDILSKANIKSPGDIKDLETLEKLQSDILALEVGVQGIRSDSYKSPQGTEKIQLPRAFTVLGQKFVLDSWATSKVVADEILWDDQKVPRLVPSCLDVAFAVLGNNQVVPDIVERIADTAGNQLRDGLNYQHNLAAVRNVIDGQDEVVWEENIYMNWLATLRQLSAPTIDVKYPEVMRTRAWAMKTVNTQLASWTQLRHDTILYAKQSYSGYLCEYPAGFVEPRPEFWERFEKMAVLAADLIQKTPFPDRFQSIQKKQSEHFQNFAQTLAILKKIAVKELAQEKLAEEESKFLKDIVEINNMSGGPFYYGWYPSLFYKERKDSDEWDAIVADVHTNVEPASVLHQAVGNVDMLMIAVDNGEDKMIYAGPVLSHYEFEMPGVSRKSDSEWREDINNGKLPPRPDWTKNYLVSREK